MSHEFKAGHISFIRYVKINSRLLFIVAQIHLHQSAKDAIRQLLPNTGHIATVAAWADRVGHTLIVDSKTN